MAINFSLKIMLTTSTCNFSVAIGASKFPFAIIFSKSGGGPSFNIVCGASNRVLHKWASHPVSMRPSMFNSPDYIGKYSIFQG